MTTTKLLLAAAALALAACKAKHLPDGDPRDTETQMLRKHVTVPGDGGTAVADGGAAGKGGAR